MTATTHPLLRKILRAQPPLPPDNGRQIVTARGLREVLTGLAGSPTPEHRRFLDGLCRQVAVSRAVLAVYEPDFRKPAAPEPLAPIHWALLIATLIAWADHDHGPTEDARGLALKTLNAALQACDLTDRHDVAISHADELRAWALATLADRQLSLTA